MNGFRLQKGLIIFGLYQTKTATVLQHTLQSEIYLVSPSSHHDSQWVDLNFERAFLFFASVFSRDFLVNRNSIKLNQCLVKTKRE